MRIKRAIPPLLAGLLLFLFVFFSANKETGSDPKLTLLVSQAMLDHRTVRLDAYQGDVLIDFPFADYVERTGLIVARDGRYDAFFPVGPSVLSLPFVAAFRALGKDMRTFDSFELQIGLAALSVTAVFFLLYLTGTYLVRRRAALLIAFVAVAGSALSSTLGTALWSLNFSAFFSSVVLWLLVRDREGGRSFNPVLLGLLLFLTYFSRPSAAAFVIPVLGYVLWQRRPQFPAVALSALLPLLAFLGWSRWEYGQWLPDYYSTARFGLERPPVWVGVLGNLLSPSRGLFWFSPFLLLIPAGIFLFRRELARQPLFWLCLSWFALQLLLVSSAVIWWGGYAFGPRLLADALPGLVLLLFLIGRRGDAGLAGAAAAARGAAVPAARSGRHRHPGRRPLPRGDLALERSRLRPAHGRQRPPRRFLRPALCPVPGRQRDGLRVGAAEDGDGAGAAGRAAPAGPRRGRAVGRRRRGAAAGGGAVEPDPAGRDTAGGRLCRVAGPGCRRGGRALERLCDGGDLF